MFGIPTPYTLGAIALAIAASFGVGYYTKSQFDKADQVDQAKKAMQYTYNGAAEARRIDNQIIADKVQRDRQFKTLQGATNDPGFVVTPSSQSAGADLRCVQDGEGGIAGLRGLGEAGPREVGTETTAGADTLATVQGAAVSACAVPVLSVGGVRLLNDARAGRVDATLGSDAESAAASDVGLRQLSASDLEVTKTYLDLARNHNTLVDWVDAHCIDPNK